MSSKFGTLLSLIFVAFFVALGADLITIQYLYSDLDAKSTSISYIISRYGRVTSNLEATIEDRYQVEFTCLTYCNSSPGDIVDYVISRKYQPVFISKEEITIAVKRQAVIGYYG